MNCPPVNCPLLNSLRWIAPRWIAPWWIAPGELPPVNCPRWIAPGELPPGELPLGELPPGASQYPPAYTIILRARARVCVIFHPLLIVSIGVRAGAYGEISGGPKVKFPGRIRAKMSPSKKENYHKDIFLYFTVFICIIHNDQCHPFLTWFYRPRLPPNKLKFKWNHNV